MQTKFNIKDVKIKCRAKTRKNTLCNSPAMPNGRCRMHGGKSTGAKTPEGLENIKKANFKNGFHTLESLSFRRDINQLIKENKEFLKQEIFN